MKSPALLSTALAVLAFAVPARDLSDTPDIKIDVMRVYGVRNVRSLDDTTVKVVLGAATGPARGHAGA